jgi:hypothetical protein
MNDPISDYIETEAQAHVTAYVIVATTETLDGNQSFWVACQPKQTASTTLGLLESAAAGEKLRIAQLFTANDNEDD